MHQGGLPVFSNEKRRRPTRTLSQSIWAYQCGEAGLFPAPELTDLQRTPSMPTQECRPTRASEAALGTRGRTWLSGMLSSTLSAPSATWIRGCALTCWVQAPSRWQLELDECALVKLHPAKSGTAALPIYQLVASEIWPFQMNLGELAGPQWAGSWGS